jgi:hypothetical protein
MEKKHKHGLLVVLLVGIVGYGGYYAYSNQKRILAKTIVKLGGASNLIELMNMDQKYLQAWAKGLVRTKPQFVYNGAAYFTVGGKKVPPNTSVSADAPTA